MTKPNFFIVGAPKCGTTSMYYYLNQHPQIFLPEKIKEPHYFGLDLKGDWFIKDRATYLSLFSNTEATAIGEASVMYLYSQHAAQEIYQFNPHAKIVIMLRNPIDVMYSFHSQLIYSGHENITDFEEAYFARPETRPKGYLFFPNFSYAKCVSFAEQIQRYFSIFGQDQIKIIFFDELKSNSKNVYDETISFLNIAELFEPEFTVHNMNKTIRFPWMHQLMYHRPVALNKIIRKILPHYFRLKILNVLGYGKKILNTQTRQRGLISNELRDKLIGIHKSEIVDLERLLQRDLSHWYCKSSSE